MNGCAHVTDRNCRIEFDSLLIIFNTISKKIISRILEITQYGEIWTGKTLLRDVIEDLEEMEIMT